MRSAKPSPVSGRQGGPGKVPIWCTNNPLLPRTFQQRTNEVLPAFRLSFVSPRLIRTSPDQTHPRLPPKTNPPQHRQQQHTYTNPLHHPISDLNPQHAPTLDLTTSLLLHLPRSHVGERSGKKKLAQRSRRSQRRQRRWWRERRSVLAAPEFPTWILLLPPGLSVRGLAQDLLRDSVHHNSIRRARGCLGIHPKRETPSCCCMAPVTLAPEAGRTASDDQLVT